MSEHLLKIGEVADFFRVSVKAIRLYDQKGIVKPAYTDPQTGYRYYTADQLERLRTLIELKALGFSLTEVRDVLSGKIDDEQLLARLTRKRLAWLDAKALAESKAETLARMINLFAESQEAGKLTGLSEEERAWLLSKLVCLEGTYLPDQLIEALWV